MCVSTDDEKIYNNLVILSQKMKKTLDECRNVVNVKTPYKITQEAIRIVRI